MEYKKYWIPGNLLIATPFYRMEDGTAYGSRPENSILLEPNQVKDGQKCYVLDDNSGLSLFNAYFAQEGITSYYQGDYSLCRTYQAALETFTKGIQEIKDLHLLQIGIPNMPTLANRQLFLSVIATLEVYLTDIYLVRVLKDSSMFNCYANKFHKNQSAKLNPYEESSIAAWEQNVIEEIIKEPKANIKDISERIKCLFGKDVGGQVRTLSNYFYKRHLIAHKNGMTKDGNFIVVSNDDLDKEIKDIETFIIFIQSIIS